jgi:hypothetical protein
MSLFRSFYEPMVSDHIDRLYADQILIERMAKGNYFGAVADGSRAHLVIPGIIDVNPVTVTLQDEGSYDGMQPQLAGEKYHVSFDLNKFPTPSAQPKQDDLLTAVIVTGTVLVPVMTPDPNFPKLRVTRVDPDGINRIVCVCSRAQ